VTIPRMSVEEIANVVEQWAEEEQKLGQKYAWVQVSYMLRMLPAKKRPLFACM